MSPTTSVQGGASVPQSFRDCLRYFLTPQVWKQAQQTPGAPREKTRWSLQPLVLALLALTWCLGDSQAERFETGRAFCVACLSKRKRPGKTLKGFEQALARLPLPVLRALAAGVRQQILRRLAARLTVHGFSVFGCDGSRVEAPRTRELEQRLGQAGKRDAAPTAYLTNLVHLATGLLWSWQIGRGTASEHFHLGRLLCTLPANALVVADAAFLGYALFQTILHARLSFLFRLSSRAYLYTEKRVCLKRFREGTVYYWPGWAQKKKLPPLPMRLLRVRHGKVDVWLLTNVLDARLLPHAAADRFYRWRWRNEGFFRTYKRTLGKVKLKSRTVALLHRELEASLLAVQLLLAHGALALRNSPTAQASPRQILLVIRQEIQREISRHLGRRQHLTYLQRLQQARLEERQRQSRKARRKWPRRKDHRPPKPPHFLTMSNHVRVLLIQALSAA